MASATATASASGEQPDREYHFLFNSWRKTVEVDESNAGDSPFSLFISTPIYAPLLFTNASSDARDHCANERTFLSWLRISTYLGIVSAAIFVNFHLKSQPSALEQRISQPLGYVFWALALLSLGSGFANYVRTVQRYAARSAIVQHGVKTQIVFGVVAASIIAACGIFLGAEGGRRR